MTAPAKAKGDRAEREAAAILADELGAPVRRKLGAGRRDDQGDLELGGELVVRRPGGRLEGRGRGAHPGRCGTPTSRPTAPGSTTAWPCSGCGAGRGGWPWTSPPSASSCGRRRRD